MTVCRFWSDETGDCPETDGVRLYVTGPRCPTHTPAVLAGRTDLVPDDAKSITGLRDKADLTWGGVKKL